MSEREGLIGIVQSLATLLEATASKPVLNQLLGMALLEASEGLVRAGFEPAKLNDLGVAEDVAYFFDAKYRTPGSNSGPSGPRRRVPYLRLVS